MPRVLWCFIERWVPSNLTYKKAFRLRKWKLYLKIIIESQGVKENEGKNLLLSQPHLSPRREWKKAWNRIKVLGFCHIEFWEFNLFVSLIRKNSTQIVTCNGGYASTHSSWNLVIWNALIWWAHKQIGSVQGNLCLCCHINSLVRPFFYSVCYSWGLSPKNLKCLRCLKGAFQLVLLIY